MSTPLLSARNVTRTLEEEELKVTLVKDVSLDIERGEFVAITGASGSGKSSLLYLLGLLDDPTSGEILFEGQATAGMNRRKKARLRLEKLGFIFQFHFLLPEFSILDNVLLPMERLGKLPNAERRERAMDILESLDIAEQAAKHPGQLSGGQRQRAAIARALANEPHVMLADEPTGNLDSKNAALVFDIFERLVNVDGKTIVTVTHDPSLAERCSRRIHIKDGRIEA